MKLHSQSQPRNISEGDKAQFRNISADDEALFRRVLGDVLFNELDADMTREDMSEEEKALDRLISLFIAFDVQQRKERLFQIAPTVPSPK